MKKKIDLKFPTYKLVKYFELDIDVFILICLYSKGGGGPLHGTIILMWDGIGPVIAMIWETVATLFGLELIQFIKTM